MNICLNLVHLEDIAKMGNYQSNSIFMDLVKAFDTVNHDILLYKLNQYGIREIAFDLIKSNMRHRKQIVQVGHHSSSISGINIGVPQDSVLGPIFFLICLNDLTYTSDLKVTLYTDDSVLFLAHKNIDFLQKSLDPNLQKVDRWLKYNQLSVNVDKTKFLLFAKSNKTLDVFVKGSKLEQIKSIKHLAVLIDEKLKCHEHIDYVANKLSAAYGILCKLQKYVRQNALISVYLLNPYCIMQYCVGEMLLPKSSINFMSVKTLG